MKYYVLNNIRGPKSKTLIEVRKKAYKEVQKTEGYVYIYEVKDGIIANWNSGMVFDDLRGILYTRYEKSKKIGTYYLNKNGTLGRKV